MNVTMTLNPRTMPDGVILVLSVRYLPGEGETPNPRIYSHAALKSGGYWYVTGASGPHMASWSAIERWLGRDNRELVRIEMATGARTIWPEPVGEAVALVDTPQA
jgi:hypothetical protein